MPSWQLSPRSCRLRRAETPGDRSRSQARWPHSETRAEAPWSLPLRTVLRVGWCLVNIREAVSFESSLPKQIPLSRRLADATRSAIPPPGGRRESATDSSFSRYKSGFKTAAATHPARCDGSSLLRAAAGRQQRQDLGNLVNPQHGLDVVVGDRTGGHRLDTCLVGLLNERDPPGIGDRNQAQH